VLVRVVLVPASLYVESESRLQVLSMRCRDGWDWIGWHPVADKHGLLLGKYKSPSPLLEEQVIVVRSFLMSIQKGKTEMSKSESKEKTNMVFLAGTLKFDPKYYTESSNVKALIDVGLKSAIQVSIYMGNGKNKELGVKLQRFRQGDFIKLVAMLRPYGVKQEDDSWRNNMSVDVTEIKTEPPQRQREQRPPADDDIPF
jgi:hypothetical protein